MFATAASSSGALGPLLALAVVGATALLIGIRVGSRTKTQPILSEDEQVAAALGVLRRHSEKRALARMEAAGARLWTPDPERVAELSSGRRNTIRAADRQNS